VLIVVGQSGDTLNFADAGWAEVSGADDNVAYPNDVDSLSGFSLYRYGTSKTYVAVDDESAVSVNLCDGSDPLVLDLNSDGIELLGLEAGVSFDVDVDGVLEATGWAGPGDGILVMDLDDSGYIENMNEVFSEVFNGQEFTGSLAALASLDDNKDLRIDTVDTAFENILVWQDANSDGISTGTELSTLTEHGIHAIDLNAERASHFVVGNRIEKMGSFGFQDGTTGNLAEVTFKTGSESFDYAAATGGSAVSGTELALSGDDATEQLIAGTNSGATSGAHFVFDSGSHTLYHDDDSGQEGYTVVATVQSGASVVASDIGFVIS